MKLSQLQGTVMEVLTYSRKPAPVIKNENRYCNQCQGSTEHKITKDGPMCLVCGTTKTITPNRVSSGLSNPNMTRQVNLRPPTPRPFPGAGSAFHEDKEFKKSIENYEPGKSISGGKQKNTGAGVQFCQKSNKEGYSGSAAQHPGNTIMSQVPQTVIKFGKK